MASSKTLEEQLTEARDSLIAVGDQILRVQEGIANLHAGDLAYRLPSLRGELRTIAYLARIKGRERVNRD